MCLQRKNSQTIYTPTSLCSLKTPQPTHATDITQPSHDITYNNFPHKKNETSKKASPPLPASMTQQTAQRERARSPFDVDDDLF